MLIIDELGLILSQMHPITDLVLKYINSTDSIMGSLLVLVDGDTYQLMPIQGTPMWLHSHMLFVCNMFLLKNHARRGSDHT